MKYLLASSVVAVFFAVFLHNAEAQEPKACINLETGRIIYVGEGMPCPYPTSEY